MANASTARKKTTAKKTPRKKTAAGAKRKYPQAAAKSVARAVDEMEHGTLRSGGSGKKVTDRKQAIAIGLSEARRAGAKVPAKKEE